MAADRTPQRRRRLQIVEIFARYFIHDPVHHLYGVTGLRVSGNP